MSQYYFVRQRSHKVLPSTTSYYKTCTKYVPVLLRRTKIAQSTSQYYFVLQNLHKARPSTTSYDKDRTKYFPVLLRTTKLAQSASQYYFAPCNTLRSADNAIRSTTRRKCCGCHEKCRRISPKCCACHDKMKPEVSRWREIPIPNEGFKRGTPVIHFNVAEEKSHLCLSNAMENSPLKEIIYPQRSPRLTHGGGACFFLLAGETVGQRFIMNPWHSRAIQ